MTQIGRGDRGDNVRAWQRRLERAGYSLAPYGADGIFGALTEHRTFQASGRLVVDDDAIPWTLPLTLHRVSFARAKYFRRASRTRVPLVVIHTAEIAEGATSAEALGRFFAAPGRWPDGRPRIVSAHCSADSDSLVESVMPTDVAWAAPGANRHGYHYEIAGFARQSAAEWRDAFSTDTLKNVAWHAARHTLRFGVPCQFLGDEDFAAFARDPDNHPGGFTEHRIVARVWRDHDRWGLPPPKSISRHTDPGDHFPWETFLADVRQRREILESRIPLCERNTEPPP